MARRSLGHAWIEARALRDSSVLRDRVRYASDPSSLRTRSRGVERACVRRRGEDRAQRLDTASGVGGRIPDRKSKGQREGSDEREGRARSGVRDAPARVLVRSAEGDPEADEDEDEDRVDPREDGGRVDLWRERGKGQTGLSKGDGAAVPTLWHELNRPVRLQLG